MSNKPKKRQLKIPLEQPPEVVLNPGIRRPGYFAGVLAEVGEDAGGLAVEAVEAGFVGFGAVAAVQDAEVAAADGFFHQLATEAGVRGAQHE